MKAALRRRRTTSYWGLDGCRWYGAACMFQLLITYGLLVPGTCCNSLVNCPLHKYQQQLCYLQSLQTWELLSIFSTYSTSQPSFFLQESKAFAIAALLWSNTILALQSILHCFGLVRIDFLLMPSMPKSQAWSCRMIDVGLLSNWKNYTSGSCVPSVSLLV